MAIWYNIYKKCALALGVVYMSDEEMLRAEIKRLKEELEKEKSHDKLTGLYNKYTYYESVRNRLDRNTDKKYAIVCIDIEKFKYINDRFGFVEGDRLLAHVGAKLLERSERQSIVAGRLSADVFSFFDLEENINPKTIGGEIQSWVSDYPLDIDIKMAVGIYHIETSSIPVRLMCDKANMAKDTVKNNYIQNVAEYNKDVNEYIYAQNDLLVESERAFINHEFKVYLQPKFDIRTNKIVGAESLVRWQHPKRGLIYPKDFIPLFEQNMLITKLDEYVWEDTCRLIRDWTDRGISPVPISVNVSRMDMFVLDVSELFVKFTDKYNIERKFIEIEITESAFTSDENKLIELVDELRSLGFKVLMDDFGSGYSSLNILKDINVDVLKIDTRFLESGNKSNSRGREILESVVRMAKWIGLQTIAEGVETDEQKMFLLNLGCYYAQGFYFSRPISEEEFEKLIQNPDNVETEEESKSLNNTIAIEELFHSDYMTESLLNNILGGVAIYDFNGEDEIHILKANDLYYDITGWYNSDNTCVSENIIERVHPLDRENTLKAFKTAIDRGHEGYAFQLRDIRENEIRWLSLRLYYFAERSGRYLYYTSVSDTTEQMRIASELDKSRVGFKAALELIEATVLEYDFSTKALEVKTELKDGEEYIAGTVIENAWETLISKHIIHPAYEKAFMNMRDYMINNETPAHCNLALLYRNGEYKICSVTAKTICKNNKPVRAIIVVKSSGRTVD